MPQDLKKAVVTLDGVPLAATQSIVWRFVSGVAPYVTEFAVHKSAWERRLKNRIGKALKLKIVDSRDVKTEIDEVYILHEAPSDSPHRAAFVVADLRWKWPYKLIARDFNMTRKTGDRTAFRSVPVENQVSVDTYDYLPYSLNKGEDGNAQVWAADEALEEVLKILAPDSSNPSGAGGAATKHYKIESFPISDSQAHGGEGRFTLQNVSLRDSGDAAMQRMLSYIPGADVYVDAKGKVIVFDATDLTAVEDHFDELPPQQWAGEAAVMIDRKKIRPKTVRVHYQREVECMFTFKDEYEGTVAQPGADEPYLENVVATPDPETEVTEYDPVADRIQTTTKAAGSWVVFQRWLNAMEQLRPLGSAKWGFSTIKRLWVIGDLDGALGAGGMDLDETGDVSMRVQALKEHFRQTFRINRKYVERCRDIRAVRVGLLDPVTGARAPARVWGQYAVIPSEKGKRVAARTDPSRVTFARNVDCLATSKSGGADIALTTPGVQRVTVEDEEVGILRIECVQSPYGLTGSFVPCLLVNERGQTTAPVRDLAQQDDKPMGFGFRIEYGTEGLWLKSSMELAALMTIVPAAPNNKRQFHVVEVKAKEVADVYRTNYRIQDGEGPDLEVFVSPSEMTARFAWQSDQQATETIKKLLGLTDNGEGIDGTDLPGFVLMNQDRQLQEHAKAVAAELLAPYADSIQGTVVTRVPDDGVKLVGNMSGASVRVATAPSAKVDAIHQFPGQQRSLSRFAMLPESVRRIVLGIVPFKE